jgi:hypothetical protein
MSERSKNIKNEQEIPRPADKLSATELLARIRSKVRPMNIPKLKMDDFSEKGDS